MSYEELDPAILAAFPRGSTVLSVAPHGKTRWSIGHHVAIEVENEEQEYFLKIIERPDWVDMARAEYDAQQALSAVIPENVVPPIAWGFFENDNTKSFYLTSFRRLSPRVPPIPKILAIVKKLHQTSISPTGKFGFQSTTYWGPPKMVNDWTDSWEEYWSRQFRSDIKYAQGVYGEDSDLANLTEEFIQKAVARLLRPLQTGGRTIKPSLCHGDLWDGNVQTDDDTKQPVLFDSACFYGHREVDLQAIGEPRYSLRMNVVDMYMNEVGADEPRDDFYDRHFLYGIRNDVVVAAICPEWESLLETAKEKMRKLLDKFPDGFEGFEASTRARRDSAFAD